MSQKTRVAQFPKSGMNMSHDLSRCASVGLHDAVLAFEVALAEDQLGVVGVEVREVFGVLPAEIVVVTRDQILDLEAIDECLRRPPRRPRLS